jgi:hypothetical protein
MLSTRVCLDDASAGGTTKPKAATRVYLDDANAGGPKIPKTNTCRSSAVDMPIPSTLKACDVSWVRECGEWVLARIGLSCAMYLGILLVMSPFSIVFMSINIAFPRAEMQGVLSIYNQVIRTIHHTLTIFNQHDEYWQVYK